MRRQGHMATTAAMLTFSVGVSGVSLLQQGMGGGRASIYNGKKWQVARLARIQFRGPLARLTDSFQAEKNATPTKGRQSQPGGLLGTHVSPVGS